MLVTVFILNISTDSTTVNKDLTANNAPLS